MSRDTYLQAVNAAMFAGRLAVTGGGLPDVAAAVRAAPAAPSPPMPSPPIPALPRATDVLLEVLVLLYTEGIRAAAPPMRLALTALLGSGLTGDADLRVLWHAGHVALALWDEQAWRALAERHLRLARQAGALAQLPLALSSRVVGLLFEGDLAEAGLLTAEVGAITTATGMRVTNYGALALAAWRGRGTESEELMRTARAAAPPGARGSG
jgi:hypothetical protein